MSDCRVILVPFDMEADNRKTNTKTAEIDCLKWPESDIPKLMKLIEDHIPVDDRMSYKCRMNKLPWDKIAFDGHNEEECKEAWDSIVQRLRRFRLLKEIVEDAKVWFNRPWSSYNNRKASKNHPNKPKRPLNSAQLYIKSQSPTLREKHPNKTPRELFSLIMGNYRALSLKEKEKYTKQSQLLRQKYLTELKVFLKQHPEEASKSEAKLLKEDIMKDSAFKLYLDEQTIEKSKSSEKPLEQLVKKYTKKWDNLSEDDKLQWFSRAQRNAKTKPTNGIKAKKRKITNDEQPERSDKVEPANGNNAKNKNITDGEQPVTKKTKKKMSKSIATNDHPEIQPENSQQSKNVEEKVHTEGQPDEPQQFHTIDDVISREPKEPPEEAIKLFKKEMKKRKIKFPDAEQLAEAWGKLSKEERKRYKKELKQLRNDYVTQYEEFISSLTKKQLKAYKKYKNIADS